MGCSEETNVFFGGRSRLLPVTALCLLEGLFEAACPLPAFSAEVGDYGSFSFNVQNVEGSISDVSGLTLTVVQAPSWFKVDQELSTLGPINISAGQSVSLGLVYQLASGYTATSSAEIKVKVTHQDTSTTPSFWAWRILSTDGLQTYSTSCQNDFGSCGETLGDDVTPPSTELHIFRPKFVSSAGTTFISTATPLLVTAIDPVLPNAVSSGVAFIGYGIDSMVASVRQLNEKLGSFTLQPGAHSIQFGSFDNSGNEESVQSKSLVVDGEAPLAVSLLVANGSNPSPWTRAPTFTLTWTNPADLSGIKRAHYRLDSLSELLASATSALSVDFTGQLSNGSNILSLWLEDNVANQDPANAATLALRYDDISPVSTVSALPLTSTKSVQVGLMVSDPGAEDLPQTGSGLASVHLWVRRDTNDDGNFGAWTLAETIFSTGSFSYGLMA